MSPISLQDAKPQDGSRYHIRPLTPDDFPALRQLESEVFGQDQAGELCPHYLRLCTDLYADWCFLALDGMRPVGYVLNFPNGKTVYCATLAVHPEFQKTRVNYLLIRAMVRKLLEEGTTTCRFLVAPENHDARSVHATLGARVVQEVQDCYYPGDRRLWSEINQADLDSLRAKYTRLRLVS